MWANAMLLLAAAIWGGGNVAQRLAADHVAPFTMLACRGALGLLAILLWLIRGCRAAGPAPRRAWPGLFAAAVAFGVALALQQMAARHSSATSLGFLLNMTIVFMPLLVWLCQRRRPPAIVCLAGVAALIGVVPMSGGVGRLGPGDTLCLLSAVAYSAWIILVGRLAHAIDRPFQIAACQFLLATLLGLAGSRAEASVGDAGLILAAPALVVFGMFSTGLAFTLQAAAQRATSAADAALIMSLESVFDAVAASVLLGETMTATRWLGAGLIAEPVLIAELGDVASRAFRDAWCRSPASRMPWRKSAGAC